MLNTSKVLTGNNYKLWIILAAGSLTPMAGGVVAPVLPELVEQLNLDPILAGNLVSMHCFTIALFSPLLGILADRIHPTKVLIPCLFLYSLFGTAGALMPNFWLLLTTRALLGIASGGIAAASLGLVGRMYQGEARLQVIGYASATLTITGVIYPLLGGLVGAFNWQFAFYLYGIAAPLAVLAVFFFSEETSTRPKSASVGLLDSLGEVLSKVAVWRLLLSISLASLVMYASLIYLPLYLKETLNTGTAINGIVLASEAIGATISSAFLAKRLAQSFNTSAATGIGFGIMAAMLVVISLLSQFHWILLAAIFFGLGFGFVLPNLYSALANLAPSQLQSSVLAAGTGAGFLGQFISPILLGPLLSIGGLESAFYGAATVAMLGGLLLIELKMPA